MDSTENGGPLDPGTVITLYRDTHRNLFQLASQLSDEQLQWRANKREPLLAYHFWRTARWADHWQAAIPLLLPSFASTTRPLSIELWTMNGIAEAWGWTAPGIGVDTSSLGIAPIQAWELPFPPKNDLLNYMRRAFDAANAGVVRMDNQSLWTALPKMAVLGVVYLGSKTIGDALLGHIARNSTAIGVVKAMVSVITDGKQATTLI